MLFYLNVLKTGANLKYTYRGTTQRIEAHKLPSSQEITFRRLGTHQYNTDPLVDGCGADLGRI